MDLGILADLDGPQARPRVDVQPVRRDLVEGGGPAPLPAEGQERPDGFLGLLGVSKRIAQGQRVPALGAVGNAPVASTLIPMVSVVSEEATLVGQQGKVGQRRPAPALEQFSQARASLGRRAKAKGTAFGSFVA